MKKNIAIVAGGDSSEVGVSLKSAEGLYFYMDKNRYNVWIVTLVGKNWQVQCLDGEKREIDKNDFSFIQQEKKIKFDFAYVTIHGTPGENGLLQGYFNLIGLPFSCCDVLPAALTFNKFYCNRFLKNFDILVAESLLFRKGALISIEEITQKIGYPCFVKPNASGSSFGITKVKSENQIQLALDIAFTEGDEVMVEKFIEGTEVTCGIYKTKQKTVVLPITEVVPKNDFFDYNAKYNGQVQEITPARIQQQTAEQIQQLTTKIYDILNCKGIVRMDYIISNEGAIYLLEINTTPGMTETSFIPQQVKAAGLNMTDVLTEIIENELNNQ
ncbi:MAG TPA: D-alanine--D-alanine ligase [Paludibacteraceae bacterium]|mgnify:FL=1|nr:D-alanine--D-alanine ligase [Paludibacteraceae bacterium]